MPLFLYYLIFNLYFILGIVGSQCVSFRGTAKGFSNTYSGIYPLFQILFPFTLLQSIEERSVFYIVDLC